MIEKDEDAGEQGRGDQGREGREINKRTTIRTIQIKTRGMIRTSRRTRGRRDDDEDESVSYRRPGEEKDSD